MSRGGLLIRGLAVGLCLSLAWCVPARAERVAGVVFLDANRNGRRDPGEKGLADVPVTDGLSFVKTSKDGRYEINARLDPLRAPGKRPILSVTFPTGYWPTAGWFRRIKNVSDPSSVHFGLRRDEQRVPFVFVHGTDPHVPRGGKQLFATFRTEMGQLANMVEFCVLTGDLVDLADSDAPEKALADYKLFAQGIADFPVPLFCTPGNHDPAGYNAQGKWDRPHPLYGYGAYCHYVGPIRWSFNYAGYHFVGVDFMGRGKGKFVLFMPRHAVTWLRRDLESAPKGTPVLLFVHYPAGPRELRLLLRRFPVKQIFAGHTHADAGFNYAGVPGLMSGSLSQTQGDRRPGYRLVRVTTEGIEGFYKATGDPHAITLDWPRTSHVLKERAAIRGGFFDPNGEIERLTVRIGRRSGAVDFRRTPICCRFAVGLNLRSTPSGFRRLELTAWAGGETASRYVGRYLVLSGLEGPFEAKADAELLLDLAGVDRSVKVVVNGQPVEPVGPTRTRGDGPFRAPVKQLDTVRVPLAKHRLKRLNAIELHAIRKPDGKPDVFCICDAQIRYDGKVFRDLRRMHGPGHPQTVKSNARYQIDLMPD